MASDNVDKFLDILTLHNDQTVLDPTDSSSVFLDGEKEDDGQVGSSTLSLTDARYSGKNGKWWRFLNEESRRDTRPQSATSGGEISQLENGLTSVDRLISRLETIICERDALRHHLKMSATDCSIPIHYDHQKEFMNMVQISCSLGKNLTDYQQLTADSTLGALQSSIQKSEDIGKIVGETQQSLRHIVSDADQMRNRRGH